MSSVFTTTIPTYSVAYKLSARMWQGFHFLIRNDITKPTLVVTGYVQLIKGQSLFRDTIQYKFHLCHIKLVVHDGQLIARGLLRRNCCVILDRHKECVRRIDCHIQAKH